MVGAGPDAQAAALLAGVQTIQQTAILALVNTTLRVDYFQGGEDGPQLKLARIYLAAHYGSIGPRAAVITGEGEFDLSQNLTLVPLPPLEDPFWHLSGYGRAYVAIVRQTPARLPWVLC